MDVVQTLVIKMGSKALTKFEPFLDPFFSRVFRIGVYPVLEGIDRGNPRHQGDDVLKVVASGSVSVLFGVEFGPLRMCEQLHRHRCDLGEFNWRIAFMNQIEMSREEGMEGVTRLVDHRLDVALGSCCIHENEW